MKLRISDFESVSFHDSPIRAINERPGIICLRFDFALIVPPLPEADGRAWKLRDCLLTCTGVRRSEKEEWHDTVSPRPHSSPENPIDEVQHEEVTDGCLELSGFTQTNNWGVWRIDAQEFELTWTEKHEYNRG